MTSYYDSPSQLRRQKEAAMSEEQRLVARIQQTEAAYKHAKSVGDTETVAKLHRELTSMYADLPEREPRSVETFADLPPHAPEPVGLTVTTRHGERPFWK